MRDLIEDIARHLRRDRKQLPDDVVQDFVRVLEGVRVKDMPCSQVFAVLDEYVEKEVRGGQAASLMPLLREHLDLCPDCCEEYEALLRVLEQRSTPAPAGHA
jgi:hypothetical protein